MLNFSSLQLRRAEAHDVPALRRLVNEAYRELGEVGLNYTATYQDEKITRERMAQGRVFVMEAGGEILATVLLKIDNFFTGRKTAYVGQLAVTPRLKKSGLGSRLMDHCEALAAAEGYEGIQLDTAIPAEHLVQWYQRRGYQIVGEMQWDGKTYRSFIFEKKLSLRPPPNPEPVSELGF